MESLSDLFRLHGSDKDADGGHSYGPTYESVMAPRRETVRDVLELGVLGGASLRAWRDYFPHARVIGLDNDPLKTTIAEERLTTAQADAIDPAQLAAALGARSFDLIVDDASHWEHDQLKSFELLRWRLRPGGVYVVEDIQCNESHDKFTALGFEVIDLRSVRGRVDDVLAVYTAPLLPEPVPGRA